jgi:hypothetical protein
MPVFAAIGAVTGIAGGIFGAVQADSQNRQAQQNYEDQKRTAKEIADKTNDYNKRAFQVDQQNYWNQYNYQWDSALQSWQRQNEIDDYQYVQSLRTYQKDLRILTDQINFNDLAAKQAYKAEDAALTGLFRQQMFEREDQIASLKKTLYEGEINRYATQAEFDAVIEKEKIGKLSIRENLREAVRETTFQKESAMVESLRKQGQASLGQAGKSRGRAQQTTIAEFYRGMSQLESALSGRARQAALQVLELESQSKLSEKQISVQRTRSEVAMANAIRDTEFNMKVLDADVASAVEQSMVNRRDIALRQYGANLSASAQTMIRPERLAYSATPIKPPERIFIEPMEAIPGAVAAPIQQSVWGPIVSGFGSAAGSLKGVDWSNPWGG